MGYTGQRMGIEADKASGRSKDPITGKSNV